MSNKIKFNAKSGDQIVDENSTKIADILAKANAFEQVPEKWRAKIEIVMRRKLQSKKAPFAIELCAFCVLTK